MENVFFFQTKQIYDTTNLFDQFKKQKIFYSYFQVDQNYFLFFYRQTPIDLQFLYQFIDVIQELDSKQRKIRSLRGFFLYALEIIESGKDYEILETNLQPFFWRKVKNTIRQNKKVALQEFLFGSQESIASTKIQNDLKDKTENLENQVNFLQQKVIQLEAKFMTAQQNSKDLLSEASQPLESSKIDQQGNYVSNQEKAQNSLNCITLGRIPEQEQIEIIQRGFQLQAEGKISLKKYYESKDTNSLFQFKRYSIKYESIRRTKLYQQLKK